MTASTADYYAILGLTSDATLADAKKAYRKLARQHHPDRNNADPRAIDRFRRITVVGVSGATQEVCGSCLISFMVPARASGRRRARPSASATVSVGNGSPGCSSVIWVMHR